MLQKGNDFASDIVFYRKTLHPLIKVGVKIDKKYAVCNRRQDFLETGLVFSPVSGQDKRYVIRQLMIMNRPVCQKLKQVGLNLAVAQMRVV